MKITTINSIEVSSLCNLNCQYCPASKQGQHRNIGIMDMGTFEKAIEIVAHYAGQGTQKELNLFGIGEPLLNPLILDFVEMARNYVPMSQEVHLNTNGILMDRDLALNLKLAGISSIDITGHHPYHTAKTIRILQEVGIPGQLSVDFMVRPNDWAGQVEWFKSQYRYKCPWIERGQVMVMSNGDVTTCCIDAFGKGVVGSVDDDLSDIDLEPFELCQSCHHDVPRGIIIEEPRVLTA